MIGQSVLARDGHRYIIGTGGHHERVFGPAVGRHVKLVSNGIRIFFEVVVRTTIDMGWPALSRPHLDAIVCRIGVDVILATEALGQKRLERYVQLFEFGPEIVIQPTVEQWV